MLPSSRRRPDPLTELRARFAARTQERLANIHALATDWQNMRASGQLDELRREAHQLAGSAGTFGFLDLAEAAASLEAAAEQGNPGKVQTHLVELMAQSKHLFTA